MDLSIKLFKGTGKKKEVLHIDADPDVLCFQGVHVLHKVFLQTAVLVDVEETKASNYSNFYTKWWDEDRSWVRDEICGACRRSLIRRMKNGTWPKK